MEQRNRGIDLLRMTAMWMVVILHILNKGGVLAAAAPLSAGQGTARLLETAAYCAVNCYGLISGYVGVQRRFRYSGALALWLRVAFYTLGITAVFACLMPGSVNGDRVLRAFFPVLFRQYWYVTAYFGMCLFIPFFNLLLNRLSKGQLRLLALSIVLVFSVLPTLRQKDVFLTDNGYSVLWLSCLYLLGGVLRLCGRQTSRRPASRGAIYAGCVLATWLVRLAGDRLWMARTGHLCDKVLLTAYTSPTVLLAAVALVLCFTALNIGPRFGRFIKYYDNLFAKNNTALFMDDSKFIDHLILSLGRPVLVEFEYDIVKIQQEGYASIQEILDKYDFRFSEGLRTCLKVVQAVEEGDLFREGVQYNAIYEYKMKIVKTYTELVKNELEKRGWLEGPLYINEVHAGTFDAILRALDAGKGKEAKKILFAAAEEDFEHDRIKECYHKELEVDKQLAPIRALNAFYEPVQVDLWGSCITREILNEDTGRFKIGKYAYRNSFLFAFDEPIPYDDTKFENLSLFENSNWRVGYIKSAFHKDLPGQLEATGSKWLLLDFYDLICDVVKYRGGYLTADSEVRGLGFYKEIKDDCELTTVEDVLSDEEIKARFDTFIEFLKRRYGKQIIFIKADVKLKFLDYQRRKKNIRGYKQATLKKKKAFLQKWQDYFEKQMDCHVIDYAKDYDADDLCVSGAFMVHYEKEFYEKGYQALLDIIYRG